MQRNNFQFLHGTTTHVLVSGYTPAHVRVYHLVYQLEKTCLKFVVMCVHSMLCSCKVKWDFWQRADTFPLFVRTYRTIVTT